MPSYRRARALSLAAWLALGCGGAPPARETAVPANEARARARAEIVDMVHRFEAGLIARDARALGALFLSESVPFVGVYVAPGGEARSRPTDARGFLAELVGSPTSWEERFTNIAVDVHDGIAIMNADYSFLDGGRTTNHGRESWALVRRGGGWKIVSVVWSVIPDA
jgi:hypothetical protein